MDNSAWFLINRGKSQVARVLMRYYQAKIEIYKIMVAEWEEELMRLNKAEIDKAGFT